MCVSISVGGYKCELSLCVRINVCVLCVSVGVVISMRELVCMDISTCV